MAKVVIDIETIGVPFEELDEHTQQYFLKNTKTEEEGALVREQTALNSVTARIVAIGMYNPDTHKGTVLFQDNNTHIPTWEEDGIVYQTGDEREILRLFWEQVKRYSMIVTFNGRGFDAPVLMLRSAMLGVHITRNLMPARFSGDQHFDLQDQLSFYGTTKKFNLDMYARAFGVASPKDGGIEGKEVGAAYAAGRYVDIARYNARDIKATAEIYEKWTGAFMGDRE